MGLDMRKIIFCENVRTFCSETIFCEHMDKDGWEDQNGFYGYKLLFWCHDIIEKQFFIQENRLLFNEL